MRWPTTDSRVSSPYGYRTHPITGVRKLHAGADFPYPGLGAPLYAVQDMTITEVSYNTSGGHIVKGRMPDGVIAGYFHMRERSSRKVGDLVSEGNRVGYMGSSGASTGPHLHFETRRADGSSFDPIPYLTQGTAAGGGATPFPPNGEPTTEEYNMFQCETPINGSDASAGIYRWIVNPAAGTKRNIDAAEYDFNKNLKGVQTLSGLQSPAVTNRYQQIWIAPTQP